MRVKVKLMGMLKANAPESGELDLDDGATIADVLTQLDVDPKAVQAFSINGSIERDQDAVLQHEDELTVLPPVGGG